MRYKQEVECSIWRPIAFRTGPLKMALRLDYLFDDTKSSNETMLSLDEAAVEGLEEVHLTLESQDALPRYRAVMTGAHFGSGVLCALAVAWRRGVAGRRLRKSMEGSAQLTTPRAHHAAPRRHRVPARFKAGLEVCT